MDEFSVEFEYNRDKNTKMHHTGEYENDCLVLRRGETFDLGLTFHNVDLNVIQESVLRFSMGKTHIKHNTTLTCCYLIITE